tara:strand:- start:348 stop:1163 length:816 start_codon:yes stop_codon:yes gene_type:complete
MKKCYRCKETKPLEEMSKTKGFCKPCRKEYRKEYNLKHREKINEYQKLYSEQNKELIKQKAKEYSRTAIFKERCKSYKQRNRDKVLLEKKKYNARPEVKEKKKLYNRERAEKLRLSKPPKVKKEKVVKVKPPVKTLEEKRVWRRAYKKRKMATDISFRIRVNLYKRLYTALNRTNKKSASTVELLGCNVKFLKSYLESKFLPTMTWDNYGTLWHIDHIIPCASFDLSDSKQQNRCFHYSNLQPLFALTTIINGVEYIGNLNKGDKIIQLVA